MDIKKEFREQNVKSASLPSPQLLLFSPARPKLFLFSLLPKGKKKKKKKKKKGKERKNHFFLIMVYEHLLQLVSFSESKVLS